jgi:NAD-dependent deacetylase
VPSSELDEVIRRLTASSRVTALTGAGVSAASGVPTFRGASGLWRDFRAEDLATPHAFARDPVLVWEWYDWRRGLIAACQPNRAHEVLAAWSRERPGVSVVTQNVDGLHERAGTVNLTRLHGSIWMLKCWSECGAAPWEDRTTPLDPRPPRCRECGGLARPGVVWFGENLNPSDLAAAEAACACDVMLVIGTSSIVYPAAGLTDVARSRGAFIVEINPEATPAGADICLREPAEVALDTLARQVG